MQRLQESLDCQKRETVQIIIHIIFTVKRQTDLSSNRTGHSRPEKLKRWLMEIRFALTIRPTLKWSYGRKGYKGNSPLSGIIQFYLFVIVWLIGWLFFFFMTVFKTCVSMRPFATISQTAELQKSVQTYKTFWNLLRSSFTHFCFCFASIFCVWLMEWSLRPKKN